jgi:hypothetical protein
VKISNMAIKRSLQSQPRGHLVNPPAADRMPAPSLSLSFLRLIHSSVLFPQDDLIPSPKDLYFLGLQSKLFRQPDRLTVSGTKNARRAHALNL